MKVALPPEVPFDDRTKPEKKEPRPAKIVTAMRAPSLKPLIWSFSGVATSMAIEVMMDEPEAIDIPKRPFRTTEKMQPQTEEMYTIQSSVTGLTRSYSPAFGEGCEAGGGI